MKLQSTLFDRMLRSGLPHHAPPLRRWLDAHKFVFDEEASEFLGFLLRRAPLEVLQEHEFAKTPYDVTWVEIDHRTYYQALGSTRDMDPDDADTFLGFLYDHGTVWQVAEALSERDPAILPFVVHMHRPCSLDQELRLAQDCGMSRLMMRMVMLGSVNIDATSDWWREHAREITRAHTTEIIPGPWAGLVKSDGWRRFMRGSAGYLKLIIAIALLLTRPGSKVLKLDDEYGHRRGFIKGKQVVFASHHKVTLRLAHRDPIKRFIGQLATGLHRRRHGVRGHWAQSRRLGRCDHNWDMIDLDQYTCTKCRAKRWWRKAHMRGDATRGYVTKDYNVTE